MLEKTVTEVDRLTFKAAALQLALAERDAQAALQAHAQARGELEAVKARFKAEYGMGEGDSFDMKTGVVSKAKKENG